MGPKADLRQPMFDVRLSFDSGHRKTAAARPLCATNGPRRKGRHRVAIASSFKCLSFTRDDLR
jgi:hypothetical protein